MNIRNSKIKYLLGLLMALVVLFSCDSIQEEEPELPEELTVLFQYEYVNWAWGYQRNGWLIDNHGNRKRYNLNQGGDWKDTDSDGYISKEDLEFNHEKSIASSQKILLSTIVQNERLISGSIDGELSEPRNTSADRGAFAYFCYTWDEERQMYKKQLLAVEGDWSQYNTNADAIALTKWLKVFQND